MGITSVVLFFVYAWGFGFALLKLLKAKESTFLERQLMRTGIGIAAVIITAMVMNLLNIPIDWKIFLLLAIAYPVYYVLRNYKTFNPKPSIRKSDINVLVVLLIFAGSLYMYASGSFAYPYLEDEDPWGHAAGVKYIAVERTLDGSQYRNFQYMNPYPPSYNFLLALMHQTESSMQWTLKFFNSLIIALSLIYFYFFTKEFLNDKNKALFALIVIAAVPAYLSHFIWAPALAMMTFFPALYSMERMKYDKKWKWVAGITIGALLLAHPTHAATLFVMVLIYVAVKLVAERDFKTYFLATLAGIAASMSWWGAHGGAFVRANRGSGSAEIARAAAEGAGFLTRLIGKLPTALSPTSGTATRPYNFQDFFVAKGQNLINNPVGFGKIVTVLCIIGLIFAVLRIIRLAKEKGIVNKANSYLIITLLWLVYTFLIVNSQTFDLPVGFFGFRVWMILAVPVAIIAAEGLWGILSMLDMLKLDKSAVVIGKIAIAVIIVLGISFSLQYGSAQQKYQVNTAAWPPGGFWTSNDEIAAYVWLTTLPANTKVFSFLTDDQVIGMDKFVCGWCEAEATYRNTGFSDSAQDTAGWLQANDYEYIIFGGMEARQLGQNETFNKINDLASSGLFTVAHQTNGAIILKVI